MMISIMIAIFVIGYLAIALEHNIHVNKAAPALIVGVLCWTVYILMSGRPVHVIEHELLGYMGEISSVLFFLLGAMTIVELIDAHEGFEVITKRITTSKQIVLLWIICFLTFFLSAALDNLATTIVMISMLRKLVKSHQKRMFFVGMVIISANAGGAWSPIGDVTTTMLWIGGQVTAGNIVQKLMLPSFVCMLAPLLVVTAFMRGSFKHPNTNADGSVKMTSGRIALKQADMKVVTRTERITILSLGIGMLVMVPIFKSVTHLPPFMGILLGLGILWLVTELMHKGKNDEDKDPLSVMGVLQKVDVPSVLFFFGILVAISSLQATGVLKGLAMFLDDRFGNVYAIGVSLGLLSAIVDNVPLVAASMGMYDLSVYPPDHVMWEFIAYCAGTGGSALIIGSAAGVAAMGMEKIGFGWYIRKISWLALIGYLTGAATFILTNEIWE
ncbi:MAG: Na+/H+ antiporter NhaD/arsenite permease-like protein [Flammeovirgaceae bacterium]|jgi:Na+/H+ antiporter NhaD/arsenite permease-like protein